MSGTSARPPTLTKIFSARQELFADADRVAGDSKRAWPSIDRAVLHASQPLLETARAIAGDGVLPRLHALHVDADRAADATPYSAARRATCARVGARDQRLRRHAAGVDAGAAERACAR